MSEQPAVYPTDGAHGARPELSIDPVVTAAQFVQALQTIRSRTMSGHEPGVVTIGTIHGGQRHNIKVPVSGLKDPEGIRAADNPDLRTISDDLLQALLGCSTRFN